MSKTKKVVLIFISLVFITLGVICTIYSYQTDKLEKEQYSKTYYAYKELFIEKKNIPKDEVTIKDIEKVEKMNSKVAYPDKKKKIESELKELKKYIKLKNSIDNSFENNAIKSSVTSLDLENIKKENSKLTEEYQNLLIPKINLISEELNQIEDVKNTINNLFEDENHQKVKEEVTRDTYNAAVSKQQSLKQQDIIAELQNYLNTVDAELSRREELERKRLEEERRKREEERRRQEEERRQQIQAAWSILNVPYISQNKNNVLNGCEVATLLMGLQYKGYLKDMDLLTYAEKVPKSTDPSLGFIHDIFGTEPSDVPHWIAPNALAEFGRTSSGYNNVIDSTGKSLDELDVQVQSGNPVIIYLTSFLNNPKEFAEGAPKNLHVFLLTGYNSITGEHILTDPWTHDNGRTTWTVSKNKIESIYNATGKRSVIIG